MGHTALLLDTAEPPGFLRVYRHRHNLTGNRQWRRNRRRRSLPGHPAGTVNSVFYGNLDVNRVAAAGHSQGADGATRAALNNPALIKTLLTFSLPITYWLNGPSIAGLTRPAFLTSTHGIFDSVIAPPVIERILYETLTVPAALGIIFESDGKRADHASIEDPAYGGNPGGELGYPTAWLAYQLRSDPTAATAFTGAHPELVSNSNWPGSAIK